MMVCYHDYQINFIQRCLPSLLWESPVVLLLDLVKQKTFPDNKIAEKFCCKRTKCTQIIKQAVVQSLEATDVQ